MTLTNFLIFFLYIIIVIVILAIVLLYLRQNRFKEAEKNLRKIQEESEEMLASFLLELKDENKEFVAKINNMQAKINEITIDSPSELEKIPYPEEQVKIDQEEPITKEVYARMLATQKYQRKEQVVEDLEELDKSKQIEDESMERKVEKLKEKGLTIEEIAKITGKGKTEIDLLLKFRRNRK